MKRFNYSAAVWTAAIGLALASPAMARGQQPPATGQPSGPATEPTQPGGPQTGPDTTGSIGGATDTTSRQNDQQKFIEKAAIANMAEIELGKLAETHAQDPQVKQFAQMMVTDHTQALDQLRQAAGGAQLPTELDKKHQKLQDKLSKLNGAEFDREYMKAMVDTHKDAAKLLGKQAGQQSASAQSSDTAVGTSGTSSSGATGTSGTTAASAGGSGVTDWAASTLPKVQTHLDQAKSLQDQIKENAKNSETGSSGATGTSGSGAGDTPGTSGTSGTSGSGGSDTGSGSGSGAGSGAGSGGTGSGSGSGSGSGPGGGGQ